MFSWDLFLLSSLLNDFAYLFFTSVGYKKSILYFVSIVLQKEKLEATYVHRSEPRHYIPTELYSPCFLHWSVFVYKLH